MASSSGCLQLRSVSELAKRGRNHVLARVAVGAAIEALRHASIIARGRTWRRATVKTLGDGGERTEDHGKLMLVFSEQDTV
jgi:hypothetical protein